MSTPLAEAGFRTSPTGVRQSDRLAVLRLSAKPFGEAILLRLFVNPATATN